MARRHKYSRVTEDTLLQIISSEELSWEYFLYTRWKGRGPSCNHCGYTDVLAPAKGKIYRCRNKRCRRKFSPTTNTIFEKSRIPINLWLKALFFMIKNDGSSAHDFYEENKICYDSAWFMVHRIRQLFAVNHKKLRKKSGVHEIDDKQFGLELSKASKEVRLRYQNKGGYTHKIPILLIHTRGKGTYGKVMCKNTKKVQEQEVIKNLITKNSTVYSDKSILYRGLEDYFATMKTFDHSKKEQGDGQGGHTNGVNKVATKVEAIKETYVRPSTSYLQRYIDELMFYINSSLKSKKIGDIFKMAMGNLDRPITRAELKQQGVENDDWVYLNIPNARPLPPPKGKRVSKTIPIQPNRKAA